MKRTIILSLLGFMTAISSMAQEAFTEGDFSYLPTGTNTVTVTACSLGEGELAIIPQSVGAYTVTAIGPNAFANSGVAAIYMPSTVTTVGADAFSACSATFIKLSPNITAIGEGAFANCPALGHLDLPDGLDRIEANTFSSTPLYTLGNTELPHLSYVGDGALAQTNLQHFPLTDAVTYLGASAFSQCQRLQDIYLPAGMTEIPNRLLSGCTNITQVTLPAGITRIGGAAFSGTGLNSIELSQYQGSIGWLAFNDCQNLDRLTLPADNPFCYTTEDGKVLYNRSDQQLLSVLPTVEKLIISYPTTGSGYAFSGTFENLTEVELPHSWMASDLSLCKLPALKKLTMRMSEDFIGSMITPYDNFEGCHFYVFDYAMDAMKSTWERSLVRQYNNETSQYEYTNLHAIERPTEELYMAEVLPMYDNLRYVTDHKAILWDADWNTAIETAYPQFFTAGDVWSSKTNYKTLFRDYLALQYLTPARFNAFVGEAPTCIKCLDGTLIMASDFDAGNYTNWYLQNNFIPAANYVPESNPLSPNYGNSTVTCYQIYEGDPAWQQPVNEVSVLYARDTRYPETVLDPSSSTAPTAVYALHMVPGVAYNIYAIVPPRHPLSYDATDETEGQEYYNKLQTRLTSIAQIDEETGAAQTGQTANAVTDIRFESKHVEKVLLHENVEVLSDVYNLLTVTSQRINASLRRDGYTTALALIGILCEPQTEFEVYPDAVASTKNTCPTVVATYDLQGRRLNKPVRGVNIIQMSDGTTRKVLHQ